jgi:hypothetical protein
MTVRLTVKIGSGDRKLPTINDDLIIDSTMAAQRAKQELAASTYIIKSETLDMPHDPGGVVGRVGSEFAFSTLGIFGQYLITSRSIELTPESARDTVVAERYGRLIL